MNENSSSGPGPLPEAHRVAFACAGMARKIMKRPQLLSNPTLDLLADVLQEAHDAIVMELDRRRQIRERQSAATNALEKRVFDEERALADSFVQFDENRHC